MASQSSASLPALRSLDLSNNRDYTCEGLSELTQLRELDLNRCDAIQDQHLQQLHALHDLETLRLYGCHKIKDPGFNKLFANLPKLTTLELAFCWWHEGHDLRWPQHLVHLDLHESKRLVDAAIESIPNKQGLRTLNLFQCLVLTDRSMASLRGLSELTWLDIGSIRALTDDSLASIATLTGLTHLGMCDNANFTGAGLARLATLTRLQELDLWHCEALTDEGLSACASMPDLRRLVLASCAKLGDAGHRTPRQAAIAAHAASRRLPRRHGRGDREAARPRTRRADAEGLPRHRRRRRASPDGHAVAALRRPS